MSGCRFKILLICVLAVVSGCNDTRSKAKSSNNPISVTDFRGEKIELKQPVTKAVCLIESTLSGIYMLGAKDQVIGISTNVYDAPLFDYYANLDSRIADKTLPAPGNWDLVSIEQVVAMQPDLVFIWASQTETIARLQSFGIPVYGVMLKSFGDVMKEMQDLGKLFGKVERAKSLEDFANGELNKIQTNRPKTAKSAYFAWPQGINHTSGTESTVNDLFNYAGVVNACPLPDEHISVNIERLLFWNPQLIVLWPGFKVSSENILQNDQLKSITAIAQKQVFELPDPFLCDLWTLKMIYSAYLVNQWAYPDSSRQDAEIYREYLLQKLYPTLNE